MKLLTYTILLVSYMLISFGLVLPYLFASKNTDIVLLGIGYLLSTPVALYLGINSICNITKKDLGDEE